MKKEEKRKIIIILIIVLILTILDQVSKIYVISTLKEGDTIIKELITYGYVENTGGSFGVSQNSTFSFIVTNIVVLGIIIKFIITQIKMMDKKTITALILILSGGFGNLIDRIFRGHVIDFIKIQGTNFPNFNLADTFLVIGYILLALSFAIYTAKEIKERKDASGDREKNTQKNKKGE